MPWLESVTVDRAGVDLGVWPWFLPAVRAMDTLAFDAGVTFLAGENGSGESTVLEAPERYFRHLSNERWTAHASRRGDAGGSTRCV